MRGGEAGPGRDAIDERIEQRIDAALRSYAEPSEVPETRVVLARLMERARESDSRSRRWWIWGAMAAACLAVMMAVGAMWVMRGPRRAEIAWAPRAPGVAENFPQRLKPGSSYGVNGTAEAVPLQSRVQRTHAVSPPRATEAQDQGVEALPRQEVFPTPRPLSDEEQVLVAFANHVPAKVQQRVIEAQKHVGDPIVIAELKIRPLSEGEENANRQDSNKER